MKMGLDAFIAFVVYQIGGVFSQSRGSASAGKGFMPFLK